MTLPNSTYENFIRDLAYSLRERATEAEQAANNGGDFEAGRAFGLRQALARMQNEAEAFGLDKSILCLDGFDAMVGSVAPPPPRRLS